MKRWAPSGYTILEVLVVMAIMSALFVMVAATIQGKYSQNEFDVAVREMESQIKDVINDVETGYLGGNEDFRCEVDGGGDLVITSVTPAPPRGTNSQCIFMGRVIQFGRSEDPERSSYSVYSVAGKRQAQHNNSLGDSWFGNSESLPAARPTLILPTRDQRSYPPGLTYGGVRRRGGAFDNKEISSVFFVGSLNSLRNSSNSGSLFLQYIVPVPYDSAPATDSTNTEGEIASNLRNIKTEANLIGLAVKAGTSNIDVCLDGEGVDKHVVYRIETGDRGGDVNMIIGDESCAIAGY